MQLYYALFFMSPYKAPVSLIEATRCRLFVPLVGLTIGIVTIQARLLARDPSWLSDHFPCPLFFFLFLFPLKHLGLCLLKGRVRVCMHGFLSPECLHVQRARYCDNVAFMSKKPRTWLTSDGHDKHLLDDLTTDDGLFARRL